MKCNIASKIIFIAVLIGICIATVEAPCVVIDRIIAVVNDEIITQRELTWLLIPAYELYKKEYTGKRLEDKMIEAEDRILNQLIEDKLILSEAKRRGIEIKDDEIEARLEHVKNSFETEEQFRNVLMEQNVTLSELRSRFKNEILKSKIVRKQVGWKVIITPNEVRKYYDSHIEEFTTPEEVSLLNILVKKEKEIRPIDEARFLIEKIKRLIEKGENFVVLAKEYSEGPNAKEGGSLGLVKKGQMIKEIDGVIFSLQEGEVSGIVESPIGYHLLKITKKIPVRIMEFEAVESEVENLIYRKKTEKSLQKWLRKLREDAYISIK